MDAASRPGSARVHQPRPSPSAFSRFYLILYNLGSAASWSYLLYRVYDHLRSPSSAPGSLASLLGNTSLGHLWPALLDRSKTMYDDVGDLTRFIQTGAIFEIFHALFGITRSGTGTVTAQVFSRIVLVWGVLVQVPHVRDSPFFTTMVSAWSIAEIIKYTTYTFSLIGLKLAPLEWLRYTLFYILYPVGAGSEFALMYYALPHVKRKYGQEGALALIVLLCVWPIALLGLMSHMHKLRRKNIGSRSEKGRAAAARAAAVAQKKR